MTSTTGTTPAAHSALSTPTTKAQRQLFDHLSEADQAFLRKAANKAYDGTVTVSGAWKAAFVALDERNATEAEAPADAKPKRARQAKAPAEAPAKAPAKDRDAAAEARVAALPEELRTKILAAVPAGYAVAWPRPSWSTLKATSEAPADASRWLILCNSHGTTAPMPGAQGREFGKAEVRPTWCPGCAKDAKASAKAEPKAPAKAPAKVSPARTGAKVTTTRLINTGKPVDGRETAARKRAAK